MNEKFNWKAVMRQATLRKVMMVALPLLLLCFAGGVSAAVGSGTLKPYESYYRLYNIYPNGHATPFSDLGQGVAHDDNNWYFTQEGYLWKIPVGIDLDNFPDEEDWEGLGITYTGITDTLVTAGYDHFGDLTHYQGKLIIPMEDNENLLSPQKAPNAFAIFSASDLKLLGYEANTSPDGSWAAVYPDANGLVYTGKTYHDLHIIYTYTVTWDSISMLDIGLEFAGEVELFDTDDSDLFLHEAQGATFSESGDLLYILTGAVGSADGTCGVYVIDTNTWHLIARSYEADPLFAWECRSGEDWYDESEGITYWDLDDGRAPGIRGQLHAIQLDVDWGPTGGDDDLYLHHYTGNIYVDQAYGGPNPNGFVTSPYLLVNQANGLAWPGARILIQSGFYIEPIVFFGFVQINSRGGSVKLGTDGNLWLSDSGMINVGSTGSVYVP